MSVRDELYAFGIIDKSGLVDFDNEVALSRALSLWQGQKVEIRIKKYKRTRSLAQNSFWWAVIVEMVWKEMFGSEGSKYDVHCFLKDKFLKEPRYIWEGGKIKEIAITKSTTMLTKEEFKNLVDSTVLWLTEQGITLPDWGEDRYVQFRE